MARTRSHPNRGHGQAQGGRRAGAPARPARAILGGGAYAAGLARFAGGGSGSDQHGRSCGSAAVLPKQSKSLTPEFTPSVGSSSIFSPLWRTAAFRAAARAMKIV